MARDSDDATLREANVDPAIAATPGPILIEDAAERPNVAVPSVRLSPQGMFSGLFRRSTVMRAASGSMLAIPLMRTPLAGVLGEWVVHVLGRGGFCRQLADRRDHARFAIVEPSPL